jgi:osmotically inducible protein OsmC
MQPRFTPQTLVCADDRAAPRRGRIDTCKENSMTTRTAKARWSGPVPDGSGTVALGSGLFEGEYGFRSRMGDGSGGTNPEELLGAAHAACFSMALSLALGQAGYPPGSVATTAKVHLEKTGDGYAIPRIDLEAVISAEGLDEETMQRIAGEAKSGCPVSKALAGVGIHLAARLNPASGGS